MALHILDRIENAIKTVQMRNRSIISADDYLLSPEGMEKLDAACMVIEAIGERSPLLFFTYSFFEYRLHALCTSAMLQRYNL